MKFYGKVESGSYFSWFGLPRLRKAYIVEISVGMKNKCTWRGSNQLSEERGMFFSMELPFGDELPGVKWRGENGGTFVCPSGTSNRATE